MRRIKEITFKFICLFFNSLGFRIYKKGKFPNHGFELFSDIKANLPGFSLTIMFDIGANVGQSAIEFAENIEYERIYCFEPVTSTFEVLRKNTSKLKKIYYFQLAVGSENKEVKIDVSSQSDLSRIVSEVGGSNQKSEIVSMVRLDDFINENAIERVDFLKIDTEGNDLEVLYGCSESLDKKLIKVIQVEASMNPINKYHVGLELLKEYLESKGYFILGVYSQVTERYSKLPYLRRADIVFVSNEILKVGK